MKKGFTLIEMLAVIVILGVIVVFVFPKLSNLIGIGREKEKEISESVIMDAAKEYSNNDKTLTKGLINNGDRKCITVQSLIDNGYIKQEDIEKVSVNASSKVKIELNSSDNLTYTVVDTCEEHTSTFNPPTLCSYNGTLTQGAEYVQGQYTYRYKQEFNSTGWDNITGDGWGVVLTDRESTEPVTSNLCSSINNKPIISMRLMFYQSQAISIDLSNFDTSNVTCMSGMFNGAQAKKLDLSSFDTSNVTNMLTMFYRSEVTELDLSSFDTSKVTTMRSMFNECKAKSINVSSFDTSKVTTMMYMFYESEALNLNLSNFDTSSVTTMRSMFNRSKATTINVSSFNTSNVTEMYGMFYKSKAKLIDLSSFDTSNVTDTDYMFGSSSIRTGYARTQADADILNASLSKPSALIFVVK